MIKEEASNSPFRILALYLPLVLLIAAVFGILGRLTSAPSPTVEMASFATSLKGRTPGQRHNAMLSANELDGAVIPPGGVFSFNKRVKGWSADEGYVKAPVSFDGELIRAYGGGLCQTSTTLYNAALLAGLPIVERHKHVFAAHYAQPGRDAAVAQEEIDLRFRNPHGWPVRIEASARGDRLLVRLVGSEKPKMKVRIITQVLEQEKPERLTRMVLRAGGTGRSFVRNPGATGCRVVTDRAFFDGDREVRRERLSDDSYQAMDRIIQVTEAAQ